MNSAKQNNLQQFTFLPLRVVEFADRLFPDVMVTTPHKGNVQVKLKEEHYPFIFGSTTQTERHCVEVVAELRNLEQDSVDFLISEWKKTLTN